MLISFYKVFIDENTFRGRFPWGNIFQFLSFLISIVSGSSRDKSNNVGVLLVFDLPSLWAISLCDMFSSIFLSTVKTLLSVSELFSLSLMGIPCISKFCLLLYCSKSLISNSREDILSSSKWFFFLVNYFLLLRPLISSCRCSTPQLENPPQLDKS